MGLFDGLGDIVKPIGAAIFGGLGAANQGRGTDRLVDWYRDQAQRDYDNQKENRDAILAYNQQVAGASAANRAAAAANAAGRAAAAAATEKNRQGALKKAQKREKQGFKEARGFLDPWHQTGQRLLPKVENLYGGAVDKGSMLMSYLTTPDMLAKLNQSKPAYNVVIPDHDYSELFRNG